MAHCVIDFIVIIIQHLTFSNDMINNCIKPFRCSVHFSIEYVSIYGCQNTAVSRHWSTGLTGHSKCARVCDSIEANNKIEIANNIATIQLIEYQSKWCCIAHTHTHDAHTHSTQFTGRHNIVWMWIHWIQMFGQPLFDGRWRTMACTRCTCTRIFIEFSLANIYFNMRAILCFMQFASPNTN